MFERTHTTYTGADRRGRLTQAKILLATIAVVVRVFMQTATMLALLCIGQRNTLDMWNSDGGTGKRRVQLPGRELRQDLIFTRERERERERELTEA